MIFSTEILGRYEAALLCAGFMVITTTTVSGCGQKGPLFLAPQSVPYTLLQPAAPAQAASAVAPTPAVTASAAK